VRGRIAALADRARDASLAKERKEKSETISLLQISWWFVDGPLAMRSNVSILVDALERDLPESLPRRYGYDSPPEYLFAETGREHFIEFVGASLATAAIWVPHPPVLSVDYDVPEQIGDNERGFRTGRLNIYVNAAVLSQPRWATNLRRTWRAISHLAHPIYGDVRTLDHWGFHRGTLWFHTQPPVSQQHPIKSWWWESFPPGPVHAAVIGPSCVQQWPAFAAAADYEDDLAFLECDDWALRADAFAPIGPPPTKTIRPAST
jgi:hypothetical protein